MCKKMIEDRKKLIMMLPPNMREFAETEEIMRILELQFENLDADMCCVLNNAFIESCDNNAIEKYEKLVGITSNTEESLENRQGRVKTLWNKTGDNTLFSLEQKILEFSNGREYSIINKAEDNYISVIIDLPKPNSLKDLVMFLDEFLPQTINFDAICSMRRDLKCTFGCGIALGTHVYKEVW